MLRLTIERKRRGLSQAQLARLADIHPATLSRLEAGKLFAYSGWRRRLERALGVPGDELFERADESVSARPEQREVADSDT